MNSNAVRNFEIEPVSEGRWNIHERNSIRGYMFQGVMLNQATMEDARAEFTRKAAIFGWNVNSLIFCKGCQVIG